MRPAVPALALLLAALPAAAQEVAQEVADEGDRAALAAQVEAFDATMQGGDMVGLYAFMPPGVKAALVEMSGLTEDEIKAQMAEQIEAAMAGATIDDFAMDAAAATYLETPEGGRTYALIPTTTDVTIEGQGRFRATSQTVGIEDGGAWWLVRVEDPQQVMILQQAYPEFAGVTFPAGATEPLE